MTGERSTGADLGSLFDTPPAAEQERMVEAMLFASAQPLTLAELEERLPAGAVAAAAVEALTRRYAGRGVHVVRIGDAYAFRTAADLGFLMTRETVETRKLSRAATETLAIIAYHQPVTRAEIEEIRGVSLSRGTLDQLLELDWIRLGRRRLTPGRPVTFIVTPAFLDHFGLQSARDLPGVAELRAAGLLDNRPGPSASGEAALFADDAESPDAGLERDTVADLEPDTPAGLEPDTPAGHGPDTPAGHGPDTPTGLGPERSAGLNVAIGRHPDGSDQ